MENESITYTVAGIVISELYEEILYGYISHFHPDEECGWDLACPPELEFFFEEEFPYLERREDDGRLRTKQNMKMPIEHELIYYKMKAEMYQEEADRFYDGLQNLING